MRWSADHEPMSSLGYTVLCILSAKHIFQGALEESERSKGHPMTAGRCELLPVPLKLCILDFCLKD